MTELECPFCRLVAGELAGEIVAQDELTVAFMAPEPASRGHALVVPRRHATDLLELCDEDLSATVRSAQRLAAAGLERLGADGVNIINGCGRAAWQSVPHFHIHVIPRYQGEPLRLPWRSVAVRRDEIELLADRLRAAGAAN
jgi:histidine triad (HIT) family protein